MGTSCGRIQDPGRGNRLEFDPFQMVAGLPGIWKIDRLWKDPALNRPRSSWSREGSPGRFMNTPKLRWPSNFRFWYGWDFQTYEPLKFWEYPPSSVWFQRSCRKAHQWRQRGSLRTLGTMYEMEGSTPLEQIHFNADNQSVTIDGGEGGIRTPGTRKRTIDFESTALDHSATSPKQMKILKNGLQWCENIAKTKKYWSGPAIRKVSANFLFINFSRY